MVSCSSSTSSSRRSGSRSNGRRRSSAISLNAGYRGSRLPPIRSTTPGACSSDGYAFDAYAPALFNEAGTIAAAGGITGIIAMQAGVFLGKLWQQYLHHDGPEPVMAFAPTRSGKIAAYGPEAELASRQSKR